MSENIEDEESGVASGSAVEEFETAIDAFVRLRDANKFSLFVSRNNIVRFIGDPAEFTIALTRALSKAELESKKAQSILEEIKTLVQMYLGAGSVDQAVDLIESYQFREELKRNPSARDSLRQSLRRKIEAVGSKLISSTIMEKSKRLSTAVGPSLEELDLEIISQRQSRLDDRTVSSPFLKLRLRYSEAGGSPFPFFYAYPWASSANSSKSFEIECDETDIDLLVTRLLEAKALLSQALDAKVQATEKKE